MRDAIVPAVIALALAAAGVAIYFLGLEILRGIARALAIFAQGAALT